MPIESPPDAMPLVNDPFWISAATAFATLGTTVLVTLLGVEYFRPRWSVRAALVATLALALASALAGLWLRSWELATACGAASLAAGVTLALRTKLAQHAIVFGTRPICVTVAILLGCLSTAVYVSVTARIPGANVDVPFIVGTRYHAVPELVALTDRGQALPLIAYDEGENLAAAELDYLNSAKYQHQIIRLKEPDTACNCHGWVYTGGRYAIQSRYINELLADNGYVTVAKPLAGDLVIYRGPEDTVEHTGLVRMVGGEGLVLVESKWGPLGVYLHPVDAQPYGVARSFYRSRRAGHLVSIVPQSSAPAERLPALAGLPPRDLSAIEASASARRVPPTEAKVYERPILRVPGHRDG